MIAQSARLAAVQTPVIPIISRWIDESPGTISLGQGIVSYGPPDEALAAARAFGGTLADHRYGPVEGGPDLVAAIEAKLARDNAIIVQPHSRVVVTAGSNLGFMNAILAITDPGDDVVLPAPYYFNHEMAIVMAGARVTTAPTTADHQLDLDAIARAIGPRTRAVVTVSPNNPTGAVYPEPALCAVNALCRERGIFHIHDEAYEYFTYGGARHFSPGSIDGAHAHTISLYSMSKAFGMASWRIGYMVVPNLLWDAINKIQDTILICAPAVSQRAAIAALQVGRAYAARHLPALDRTRRRVRDALGGRSGWTVAPMDGAFYCFVHVHTTFDAMAVTERLIRDHRVAVVPGSAFGVERGCYLRVSYGALDDRTVEDGLERLVSALLEVTARCDPHTTT